MKYLIYNTTSGEIIRHGQCPTDAVAKAQVLAGQAAKIVEGGDDFRLSDTRLKIVAGQLAWKPGFSGALPTLRSAV